MWAVAGGVAAVEAGKADIEVWLFVEELGHGFSCGDPWNDGPTSGPAQSSNGRVEPAKGVELLKHRLSYGQFRLPMRVEK